MVRPGRVEVRIGAPISGSRLVEGVQGKDPLEQARELTELLEGVLRALGEGKELSLETWKQSASNPAESSHPQVIEAGVSGIFRELEARFLPDAAETPVSYYFSLDEERWTLMASKEGVRSAPGKALDQVDCVLKTSPAIFERIIREAYVPDPAEFLSGAIKTNNIPQLLRLQSLFQLQIKSSEFWAKKRQSETASGGQA
jgi:long-chain acyl-CoA synthetase